MYYVSDFDGENYTLKSTTGKEDIVCDKALAQAMNMRILGVYVDSVFVVASEFELIEMLKKKKFEEAIKKMPLDFGFRLAFKEKKFNGIEHEIGINRLKENLYHFFDKSSDEEAKDISYKEVVDEVNKLSNNCKLVFAEVIDFYKIK